MKKVVVSTLVAILSSSSAFAADFKLYKYRDHQGNYSIGTSLPSEFSHYGYQVLNQNHKVIKVVPKRLSQNEIARLKITEEKRLAEEKAAEEQYKKDIALLKLYQKLEDIDLARERKVKEINEKIKYQNDNIIALTFKKEKLESEAVKYEYIGQKVSKNILNSLGQVVRQIEFQKRSIVEFEKQIETSIKQYEDDKVRYQQIKRR